MVGRRILLADDHGIVLDGMRRILEPEYEIVGAVTDGRQLIEAADKLRPDVIVVDISMPLLNGLEAVRQLKKLELRAKIVFLTMHAEVDIAVEAIRLGASGYILKHSAADELQRAVREVLDGGLYINPRIAKDVMTTLMEAPKDSESPATQLTRREREVLQLVAEGRTMPEIADVLEISVRTVEFHKYNVMDKLHMRTTAELTKYATKHGLVSS